MQQVGIDTKTLSTLKKIATSKLKDSYYLAGGTACALHLGHRVSYDLDFFSAKPIDPLSLINQLSDLGNLEVFQNEPGTFNGQLDETKISFFKYPYPLIENTEEYEQVHISSIQDLAGMKIEAIASRGAKRDFVDLYYISQSCSLMQTVEWFKQKFHYKNVSVPHVLKSLVYFQDADSQPEPNMIVDYSWVTIRKYFTDQVKKIAKELAIV